MSNDQQAITEDQWRRVDRHALAALRDIVGDRADLHREAAA
ncbi:hypothetical protein [Streptomyces griseoaurantiacus]